MNRRELLRLLGLAPLASGLAPLGDIAGASQSGQAPRAFTGAPDVELSLTAARGELNLLPGAPTRVWRFMGKVQHGPESSLQVIPGSYLGPVIRLRRGQKVRIRFKNSLAEPSIVHWHGLDVPEAADGHPRLAVAGGPRVRLRVRGPEPRRHLLVSPASPHAGWSAGLSGTRRAADRGRRGRGRAWVAVGIGRTAVRAAGPPDRRRQSVRLRRRGRRTRDGPRTRPELATWPR